MSDYTQAYFDYKATTRIVAGVLLFCAMAFGTCAYGWHNDQATKDRAMAEARAYRKQMLDQGYIEVLKPCTPTGELIWEKK